MTVQDRSNEINVKGMKQMPTWPLWFMVFLFREGKKGKQISPTASALAVHHSETHDYVCLSNSHGSSALLTAQVKLVIVLVNR